MIKLPDSMKTAASIAKDLLRNYNVIGPPVNISKILEGEGISLHEFTFPEEIEDIAGVLDYRSKTIFINEQDEDYNKSMTAAHELGHWLLHTQVLEKYPDRYSFVFKKRGLLEKEDQFEQEANCFARHILVPRAMLDAYWQRFSIYELSKIFGVSPYVIEKRVSEEYYNA